MFRLLTALVILMASNSALADFPFNCSNDDGWTARGTYDNVSHGRAYLDHLFNPDGSRPLQYGLLSQRLNNATGELTLLVNVYRHGKIELSCDLRK